MLTVGDRVKYIGKTGVGYPFPGETGRVVQTSGSVVKVTLRDGQSVNLPDTEFKTAPIIIPIAGYSLVALTAVILTWRIFK